MASGLKFGKTKSESKLKFAYFCGHFRRGFSGSLWLLQTQSVLVSALHFLRNLVYTASVVLPSVLPPKVLPFFLAAEMHIASGLFFTLLPFLRMFTCSAATMNYFLKRVVYRAERRNV